MGVGPATAAKRLLRLLCLGMLALVTAPLAVACAPADSVPDLSTRESFARSVMAAATSGSVEQVESLVSPDRINVRPEAQQLLEATRGWAPGSWELRLSNDFPEFANVEVSRKGQGSAIRYAISWTQERWALVIGQPKNPPSTGAGLGPGAGANPKTPSAGGGSNQPGPVASTSQPPLDCAGGDAGGAGLACQHFTSAAGNAAGQNLYWLTSTPLHMSFDRTDASLTMVVRMPCGVLNVPVTVDAFGLTPVPGRMAESADGCSGPAAEQRGWAAAYFREPMIYRLEPHGLVLTNRLGQIRFAKD
jgi:hypothetical protein